MKKRSHISLDRLHHALLDGELSAEDAEEVRSRTRNDPAVARRLESLHAMQKWLAETRPTPRREFLERLFQTDGPSLHPRSRAADACRPALAHRMGKSPLLRRLAIGAAAAAAVLVGLFLLPKPSSGSIRKEIRESGHAHAQVVQIAADFNGWDPSKTRMKRTKDGEWHVSLKLPPRTYEYALVVDGEWIDCTGPSCHQSEYGPVNVLVVMADDRPHKAKKGTGHA